jgi:hypothetical protein
MQRFSSRRNHLPQWHSWLNAGQRRLTGWATRRKNPSCNIASRCQVMLYQVVGGHRCSGMQLQGRNRLKMPQLRAQQIIFRARPAQYCRIMSVQYACKFWWPTAAMACYSPSWSMLPRDLSADRMPWHSMGGPQIDHGVTADSDWQ